MFSASLAGQAPLAHLLRRLNEVLQRLEQDTMTVAGPNTLLADVLDSMAMVEFLAVLALSGAAGLVPV